MIRHRRSSLSSHRTPEPALRQLWRAGVRSFPELLHFSSDRTVALADTAAGAAGSDRTGSQRAAVDGCP